MFFFFLCVSKCASDLSALSVGVYLFLMLHVTSIALCVRVCIYLIVVYRVWATLVWSCPCIYICPVFPSVDVHFCHYHLFLQSIPSIYTSLRKTVLYVYMVRWCEITCTSVVSVCVCVYVCGIVVMFLMVRLCSSVHLLFQCVILWEWQQLMELGAAGIPSHVAVLLCRAEGRPLRGYGMVLWLLFIMRKDEKKFLSSLV